MAKPQYWTAQQCADHLETNMNNFRQIVYRQQRIHDEAGCTVNTSKCHHVIVDHRGGQLTFYVAQNVIDYALVRQGALVGVNAKQKTRDLREFTRNTKR